MSKNRQRRQSTLWKFRHVGHVISEILRPLLCSLGFIMSTFNGLIAEFPDIRGTAVNPRILRRVSDPEPVDNFRQNANANPPLACFLSHIHSDHLAGLESLRSPFVYCSAATREMLLRLERFPCRINYAKGILEARVQTYKHLKNLLVRF